MLKILHLNEFIRMMSLMKKKIWIYIFALVLGCGINCTSNIINAFVNKNMVKAAETGNMSFMKSGVILVILSFVLGCIIFPICIYLKVHVIKRVMLNIKLDIFKHVEKLPVSYHENNHSGDLTSRLMNDINIMEEAYDNQMQVVGVSLLGCIGSVIAMFALDWHLSIITILLGIVSARINFSFAMPLREISGRIQNSLGVLNHHLVDIMAGFRISKLFNIGTIITGRYIKESEKLAGITMERVFKNSQLNSSNYLLSMLSMVGIYIVGSIMAISGNADISTVVAIVTLQKGINFMFTNFGNFFAQLQGSLAGAGRVFEILDQSQEPDRYLVGGEPQLHNMLMMENISFSYGKQISILNDFSITVPEGKVTALVGISGSGKSTAMKLLMGFYPPYSGNIVIAGKPMGAYTLKELRQLIAYVPQDAHLFAGTVKENIRYGRPNATSDEVVDVARKANAHDFIMKMPEGYDTQIGERGLKLSGGQKQCIAIARAFIKNAPLLLLDEATSALDSESEQLVQEALNVLMQGRTTLVIAHRLSTIEKADIIYVVESGKVSEFGTHDELIVKSGLYKKLYNIQFQQINAAS